MLISFKGLGFLWNEQAAHGSTRGLCLLTGDNYGEVVPLADGLDFPEPLSNR